MKNLILLLLLTFSTLFIKAQTIDFSGGYAPDGIGANINYNHFLNKDYLQFGIYAAFANAKYNDEKIPYQDITLNVGYFYSLYQNGSQTVQASIGGGGLLGYEYVNSGKNELSNGATIDANSKFIYGGYLSGEVDFTITTNLLLLLKYNQYYHLGSEIGSLTLYGGGGLRFYIK